MESRGCSAPRKGTATETCNHHWVIDSPSGPTSIGICKHCGAVKEFTNYLPYSSWDDDRTGTHKKARRAKRGAGTRAAND